MIPNMSGMAGRSVEEIEKALPEMEEELYRCSQIIGDLGKEIQACKARLFFERDPQGAIDFYGPLSYRFARQRCVCQYCGVEFLMGDAVDSLGPTLDDEHEKVHAHQSCYTKYLRESMEELAAVKAEAAQEVENYEGPKLVPETEQEKPE